MLRTFTTKIKTIVSIRIKNKHNPHIKTLFNVEENYTYSKHTINKINKQKKKMPFIDIGGIIMEMSYKHIN